MALQTDEEWEEFFRRQNEQVCSCGHTMKDHGCNGEAGLEPSSECGYCDCQGFTSAKGQPPV